MKLLLAFVCAILVFGVFSIMLKEVFGPFIGNLFAGALYCLIAFETLSALLPRPVVEKSIETLLLMMLGLLVVGTFGALLVDPAEQMTLNARSDFSFWAGMFFVWYYLSREVPRARKRKRTRVLSERLLLLLGRMRLKPVSIR